MASAFSSGEDAMLQPLSVELDRSADKLSPEEFAQFYEIPRTVQEILQGDYKRIALQFPDELLHDSVPIYRLLKTQIGPGRELYVLADTSYGSCCVDEVAAQHVEADAMVHYGYACMSQTSRLPVTYVFGRKPVNVVDCVDRLLDVSKIASSSTQSSILKHDVSYAHAGDEIFQELQSRLEPHGISLSYSPVVKTSREIEASSPPMTDFPEGQGPMIFYVGGENLGLTNLLMTHSTCEVYSYNPITSEARLESHLTNRLLMRRYAVVQKAKDADVIGILVGTLGVASYLPLIKQIRAQVAQAHKKSYTITVGKLNPSKLANFMEIECFVLVACPENSLVESKEFLRPIVTPFEMGLALHPDQAWTGRYVLDFGKLVSEHEAAPPPPPKPEPGEDSDNDEDQPRFSLISGTYKHAKRYGNVKEETSDVDSSALVVRNDERIVATSADSAAGLFLQTRSYQGLESRIGQDEPSVLEQGRSGIAKGYQDDH